MTLKEYRVKHDLSQVNMAQRLGVSITGYINWERGVMRPNKENQKKIDELFKKEDTWCEPSFRQVYIKSIYARRSK